MSALTVTLGADITALKRAMAGITELVGASARKMGRLTGAGLAHLGKGGAMWKSPPSPPEHPRQNMTCQHQLGAC